MKDFGRSNQFVSELQDSVKTILESITYKFDKNNDSINSRLMNLKDPAELAEEFEDILFRKEGRITLKDLSKKILEYTNNPQLPGYIGHQNSPPNPIAIAVDMISRTMINPNSIFELSPSGIAIEKSIINWMCRKIGYGEGSGGIITSGGSLGNLTALLTASHVKIGKDIWKEGLHVDQPLSVLVSDQSHYSIKRAVQILGFGEDGIESIETDNKYRIKPSLIKAAHERSIKKGRKVFAFVANSCSTATGSYDPLNEIADYCEKNNLWLHIDGAHGASALISEKYKHYLKGIERADSVVWDSHKMLLCPSLCTGLLFKDGSNSYKSFTLKAAYIFGESQEQNWYDPIHRTVECTKPSMAIPLYTLLSVLGEKELSNYVESRYDLAKWFIETIKEDDDFEEAVDPDANIVCFRYNPKQRKLSLNQLNKLQNKIREQVLNEGNFYIVQAILDGITYLRMTIINPLTNKEDLLELVKLIKTVGRNF